MSDNQQMFPESEGYRITDSYTRSAVSALCLAAERKTVVPVLLYGRRRQNGHPHPARSDILKCRRRP